MTLAWEIAGGALIGALLGVFNVYLLRLSVRRGLAFRHGWKALAVIMGTYAARYLVFPLPRTRLVGPPCPSPSGLAIPGNARCGACWPRFETRFCRCGRRFPPTTEPIVQTRRTALRFIVVSTW